MLKPFYLLEGEINLIKVIKEATFIEETWQDAQGDRSIIIKNIKGGE